jgi:hypothetical protein
MFTFSNIYGRKKEYSVWQFFRYYDTLGSGQIYLLSQSQRWQELLSENCKQEPYQSEPSILLLLLLL